MEGRPNPQPSRGSIRTSRARIAAMFALAAFAVPSILACESTPLPSSSPSTTMSVPGPTRSGGPSSRPSAAQSPAAAAFHWNAPIDGVRHDARRLMLSVTADRPDAADAKVVFSVSWRGTKPKTACTAGRPDGDGIWRCQADLVRLRAPAGRLELDFDVDHGSADVESSPDGTRTLDYRPPAPRWRAARQVLPKDCYGPVLVVDASSRYHVAASCNGRIGYAEGGVTGTWARQLLKPPARHTEAGPQIAIDGADLYLAYTRYGPPSDADTCGGPYSSYYKDLGVYVRKRTLPDGAWSKPRRLGRADDILEALRVADGTLHAVVTTYGGAPHIYESDNGGSLVRATLKGIGPYSAYSLRVGSDGKARIAYINAGDGSLRLMTTDGSATNTTVVARGKLENPLLVLGPGNQPHIVWTRFGKDDGACGGPGHRDPTGTYYGTLANGTWAIERVTKATGPLSFVVDTDTGGVHVLVNVYDSLGNGRLTHYERAPRGGWTATPLKASVDGGFLIRLDEADGTLVVAYQDGRFIRVMTRR
jgi:hypothetical protein